MRGDLNTDHARAAPTEHPMLGLWGTVRTVDGDQVTVTVQEFDRGVHHFGPIPYQGGAPSVGDPVFLHFDSQAKAAYAATTAAAAAGIEVLDEYSTVMSTAKLNFVGPMVTVAEDLTFPDEATIALSLNTGQPHICTGGSDDLGAAISAQTTALETGPADATGRVIQIVPDGPAPVGSVFTVSRLGSGTLFVQLYAFGPPTVTLRGKGGVVSTGDGHYYAIDLRGTATLRLRAANDWVISGDVTYV